MNQTTTKNDTECFFKIELPANIFTEKIDAFLHKKLFLKTKKPKKSCFDFQKSNSNPQNLYSFKTNSINLRKESADMKTKLRKQTYEKIKNF